MSDIVILAGAAGAGKNPAAPVADIRHDIFKCIVRGKSDEWKKTPQDRRQV